MQTKLHINITQGIVDVEGDLDFVREVYADFKSRLLTSETLPSQPTATETTSSASPTKAKAKRRTRSRDKATTKEPAGGIAIDSPKLDKNLDTRNLQSYFAQFEPTNNSEKILIYLKFITEELEITSPNTDQVYTCFRATRQKIPGAFAQAFYTMSSRQGFIELKSATDISITIAGENYFSDSLKRKSSK